MGHSDDAEGEVAVARVGARLAAATPLTRALDRVERERLAELLGRVSPTRAHQRPVTLSSRTDRSPTAGRRAVATAR